MKTFFILSSLLLCAPNTRAGDLTVDEEPDNGRYTIEGRVYSPDTFEPINWQADTKIQVNAGEFLGFLRQDGSFVISNVPSGSYIVEVINPDFMYEPMRVEINTKGKFRARKVNHIQTSLVIQVPYPLKMKALSKFKYFQVREQWRMTDFLFNPMVLMMVLPLLLIMVLPKMMSDPETKKEMESLSSFTKMQDMPDVSEMITSFFSGGGGGSAKPAPKAVKAKKRQ